MKKVLFVDDDKSVREALGQTLDLMGFDVKSVGSFIEATDHISPSFDGAVLSDVRMPGKDGFDLLARCKQIDPDIPVVLLTGEGDIPLAVKAMENGAQNFLEKPVSSKRLAEVMERACALRTTIMENRALKTQLVQKDAARLLKRLNHQSNLENRSLAEALEIVEKHLIEEALQKFASRMPLVCAALNIPRKTLYDRMKRLEIDPAEFR